VKLFNLGMGGGLLLTFFALTVLSGVAVIGFPAKLASFAFIVPVIFLFIAIGAFLLLLLHYAYSLHEMNPTLSVSALGLPDGSIRAFLTIGLMSLVAVFGTFIYFESGKVGYVVVREKIDVSKPGALEALKASAGDRFIVISNGQGQADVLATSPDSSRTDIAKQLLTMIATVLTTVIGFYFGSRTTEGQTGAAAVDPDQVRRRSEAIIEMATWTQDLEARRKRLDDLMVQAGQEATALKATTDPQGEAEAKLGEYRTKLASAWTALDRAKDVVARNPDDTRAVLEARDAARATLPVVIEAETKLQAFCAGKQPGAL